MSANGVNTIQAGRMNAYSPEQIDIIKNTVAVGVSDGELALFMEVCKSMNLNPFKRQIYAVVRKTKAKDANGNWSETAKMVIQTGIDGYRKIAANTGLHAGTSDPEYGPEINGFPSWSRVTVKKLLPNGMLADFPATARWAEYVQTVKDYKTGNVGPNTQWAKMPFLMLGKCAESLALRKAFPDELSGVLTEEEMEQADNDLEMGQATFKAGQAVTTHTSAIAERGWTIEAQEEFASLADRLYTAFKAAGKMDAHPADAEKWRKRMANDPADTVIPAMQEWTSKIEDAAEKAKAKAIEGEIVEPDDPQA